MISSNKCMPPLVVEPNTIESSEIPKAEQNSTDQNVPISAKTHRPKQAIAQDNSVFAKALTLKSLVPILRA